MEFISVNGKIIDANTNCIPATNRNYRYGDGLFETMKVKQERILLSELHFARLFNGLNILKIRTPNLTPQKLEKEIVDLCEKNHCTDLARVRLSLSRGNGGLSDEDEQPTWVIECWPLHNEANLLNENGLIIDVFPDARKSCDLFSNLKSASHLTYAMAARFAKENKLNDCLVLNTYGRLCESSIANIFWIKEEKIFTPPLSEGCIAGVTRRHLLQSLQGTRNKIQEKECEIAELENADEIFLTNAIQGIRWVKQFGHHQYINSMTTEIYREFIKAALFN